MRVSNFWDKSKYILQVAILALIYFASAKMGLSLAFGVKQVTLVWPPTGIAIAALIIFDRKIWPGILIGAFLANITTHETVAIASQIAIGNTLEVLTAWYLLNRFKFDKEFQHIDDIVKFIIWGAIVPTMVSATIGTLALGFGGTIGWQIFRQTWLTWWLGDAVGAIIFAPLVLSLKDIKIFPFSFKKLLELLALIVSTTFVSVLIFTSYISEVFSMYPTKYLVFPFMIWAALRFGVPGATWISLLISGVSILGFITGGGPFVGLGNPELGLLLLQLLMAVFTVTSIILAAAIEEKKRTEGKVEASEKKFRSLIEYSYEAIILVNPTGTILYASPSTKRILGYSPESLVGSDGFKLIYPEDKPILVKSLAKLLFDSKKVQKIENRIVTKEGDVRWAEATGTNLLQEPEVAAIVINFRDITDHKKLDETKSEFVSLAAHELRNPLTNIRWYTEALLKSYLKKDSVSGYITEIYAATMKMTSLVNMLLNVSKVELGTLSDHPEEVDIVIIAKDVVQNQLQDIRKRGIKFTQDYGEKSIVDYIDPSLVRIIIENLLSNSIKYTQETGKIALSLNKSGREVVIIVTDNGIGIPESEKSKIFTKLFRAGNVRKRYPDGTGLGLYLVHAIVERLRGKISFESKEGGGTKFTVSFPLKTK